MINWISLKEIRAGINAFTLMEKELKTTNIPLKESVILSTLRVNIKNHWIINTIILYLVN